VAWRVPALRRLRRIRAEAEPAPAAAPAK
jgi:hypothetical protein